MPKPTDTVSIRLPTGMADQLRAASGQPVSRLARWLLTEYLNQQKRKAAAGDGVAGITAQRIAAQSSVAGGEKVRG